MTDVLAQERNLADIVFIYDRGQELFQTTHVALSHSCQCHYQVCKSWEHKEKLLVVGIQTCLLESVP